MFWFPRAAPSNSQAAPMARERGSERPRQRIICCLSSIECYAIVYVNNRHNPEFRIVALSSAHRAHRMHRPFATPSAGTCHADLRRSQECRTGFLPDMIIYLRLFDMHSYFPIMVHMLNFSLKDDKVRRLQRKLRKRLMALP